MKNKKFLKVLSLVLSSSFVFNNVAMATYIGKGEDIKDISKSQKKSNEIDAAFDRVFYLMKDGGRQALVPLTCYMKFWMLLSDDKQKEDICKYKETLISSLINYRNNGVFPKDEVAFRKSLKEFFCELKIDCIFCKISDENFLNYKVDAMSIEKTDFKKLIDNLSYFFLGPLEQSEKLNIKISTAALPVRKGQFLNYFSTSAALSHLYNSEGYIPDEKVDDFCDLACRILDCCFEDKADVLFGENVLGKKEELKKLLQYLAYLQLNSESKSVQAKPSTIHKRIRGQSSYLTTKKVKQMHTCIQGEKKYIDDSIVKYYQAIFRSGLFNIKEERIDENAFKFIVSCVSQFVKEIMSDINLSGYKSSSEFEFVDLKDLRKKFDKDLLIKTLDSKNQFDKIFLLVAVMKCVKDNSKFIFDPTKCAGDEAFIYNTKNIYNCVLTILYCTLISQDKKDMSCMIDFVSTLVKNFITADLDVAKSIKKINLMACSSDVDISKNVDTLEQRLTSYVKLCRIKDKKRLENQVKAKEMEKRLNTIRSKIQSYSEDSEFKTKASKIGDDLKKYSQPIKESSVINENDSDYVVIEKHIRNCAVDPLLSIDDIEKSLKELEAQVEKEKILKEAKPSKDEITSRVNCTVDAVISSSSQNDHALQALYSLKNAKLYYINESVKKDAENIDEQFKEKYCEFLCDFKNGIACDENFKKFQAKEKFFKDEHIPKAQWDKIISICNDCNIIYWKSNLLNGKNSGLRVIFGINKEDNSICIFYVGSPFHASAVLSAQDFLNADNEKKRIEIDIPDAGDQKKD